MHPLYGKPQQEFFRKAKKLSKSEKVKEVIDFEASAGVGAGEGIGGRNQAEGY